MWLDEAVVRSGRFGRFIPVPPPTLDEAAEILNYYLEDLCNPGEAGHKPRVQVLSSQAVRSILQSMCDQNARERRFFCGADLEEAVNRAYSRRLRETVSRRPAGSDLAAVTVEITGKDLWDSLNEVPRSIGRRTVARFLKDVDLFCGGSMAKQLSQAVYGPREDLV